MVNKQIVFFFFYRYTADNDGYRADVSYIIDQNAVEPQHHHGEENSYANYGNVAAVAPPEQHYHHLNTYNTVYDASSIQSLAQPVPTSTSSIYYTTAQPPIETDSGLYSNNELTIEQRKSISARPTFIVSAKSTQITEDIPEHNIYYKSPQHHTVFYKTHK